MLLRWINWITRLAGGYEHSNANFEKWWRCSTMRSESKFQEPKKKAQQVLSLKLRDPGMILQPPVRPPCSRLDINLVLLVRPTETVKLAVVGEHKGRLGLGGSNSTISPPSLSSAGNCHDHFRAFPWLPSPTSSCLGHQ